MSERSIFKEYIQHTIKHETQYGSRSIVLMQVGAFFEVYGFKCAETGEITKTQIVEFAQICNLNVADKKFTYEKLQVVMAGFRDYTLEKYIQRLTECGYTVAVYVQEKKGKDIIRVLDGVHSIGTYLSYETENLPQMTNNIACIWIDLFKPTQKTKQLLSKNRDSMVCGVSIINTYTGKSSLSEYQSPFIIQPSTFDELQKIISTFVPSEIILVSSLDQQQIDNLLQFSGILFGDRVHRVQTNSEKPKKCSQQKYIQHILSTIYENDAYNIYSEFQMYSTATQAFCYLIDFIQEHNSNLVKKIAIPEFYSNNEVLLANHTLKQLNILDDSFNQDSRKCGKLSSVSNFLNKCCTSMGKRKFHIQLVKPTIDIEWLNTEYEMINSMVNNNYSKITILRRQLKNVHDLEILSRQLVLLKIYPSHIFNVYQTVEIVKTIWFSMNDIDNVQEYLVNGKVHDFPDCLNSLLEFIENQLFIDKCKTISSMNTFDENIIQPAVSLSLDSASAKHKTNIELFENIKQSLNLAIQTKEKNVETDFIKIHTTEKSGVSLQITKKRGQILKKIILENGDKYILGPEHQLRWNDIKLTSCTTTCDEIDCPFLTKLSRELLYQKDEINRLISIAYKEFLIEFETRFYLILEQISNYLAKLDVLQCKSFIAREYNYCCPKIMVDATKSFIDAEDIRHVLIEHIQTNEIYVTNSLILGDEKQDGILLYGTNAVGKTSFIRAIGISIILAQAGMFVPCSKFHYKPFTKIFSRIIGNDNLFKGLSTFAVEMSELRVILKLADENSLILGDELCSGTETESALSIFTAGLMDLHCKQSSFIFATHFHEIINYEEIKSLTRMTLKHMSVHYDRETDALIYDRKLKNGPGNRMYGLEVCKSLHLKEDFLEQAYKIRTKYFPETRGELSSNITVYNSDKIRGICELCKLCVGDEIHHIEPQKMANIDGFIKSESGTFHKNHPANLLTVCEKCHNKIHSKTTKDVSLKIQRKKTTKGYKLSVNDTNE